VSRSRHQTHPTPPAAPARWLALAALVLTAVCLLGLFSTEIADTDFWWHLKTGQFIAQRHSLPVPDPFSYTTQLDATARFNLTHEWLAQVLLYIVYVAGGFPAIIFIRATLLAGVFALAGFLAARFSGNFYAGIAAAFATSAVAVEFTADRPALVTFLFVAVFVTLLETRRAPWALPPLALLWANCHSGFFLGWVVLLAYCAESWTRPREDRRRLWLVAACSIAASLINPNGFAVLNTLLKYQQSELQRNLLEWRSPSLWGSPYAFDILLYAAVLVLILSWRKVRLAHWILFVALAGASLLAFRNTLFIGFLAPVLIAAYFPFRLPRARILAWAVPPLLAAAVLAGFWRGALFQLRVADWTTPAGAADYLLANHVTGPVFNTYEQGGYLIWRLAPAQRVFIDGRALSESVNRDYRQILDNRDSDADRIAGPRADLLNRYGVQLVVMNAIDYVSGALYPLALALANPETSDWQLVYDDPQDLIFARGPAQPDKLRRVLLHLDGECSAYIEHSPDTPLCARTLADYWLRNGVADRGRRMLRLYLAHARDEKAEQMLKQLGN
jgi:hypothetical protein